METSTPNPAREHTGRATDEELARLRAKIGQRIDIREAPYVTEVTRDAIRHWAWATGDRNPLYLDRAYAKASPHGDLICPPTMLYAFSRISIGYRGGLPGVHSMFAGSHWRWHEPIPLGQSINAEVTFKDLVEFPSRFADRMFKQVSSIRFVNEEGHEYAQAESWGMRVERSKAAKKDKYGELKKEKTVYTKEKLAEIAEQYANEHMQGSEKLYYEDIDVGSEVPRIVRGPYTATTAVAFEQGWGGLFIWAHGFWYDYLKRHPAVGIANDYGIPEPPEAVHWDTALAQSVGVPEAYDYGPERISWIATMLTNWAGDHGFMEELYTEIRRFNLVGDLTYCIGKVVAKEPAQNGMGRIKLGVECRDQRDQLTAKGWAQVLLPMRAG